MPLLLVCHTGRAFPLSRAPRFGQFHTDSSQGGFLRRFFWYRHRSQAEKKTKESLQGLKPDSSDDIFGGVETPPFRFPLVDLTCWPLLLVGPRFPFAVPAVAPQFLKKRGIKGSSVA